MAAEKAVEFHRQLETQRSSLTANQLKKARQKRSKLFQQAMMADLVDGCQPAAKRIKFCDDDEPEASMSRLPEPSSSTQQDLSMTADSALASRQLSDSHAAQQQLPLLSKPLQPLRPRSKSYSRAGGLQQAADMSDVLHALHHQSHSEQQQQQQQQQQQEQQMQQVQQQQAGVTQCTHGTCMSLAPAAAAAAAAASGTVGQPAPSGSSSLAPCRADLSCQLAVIKQELSTDASTDHNSSSSSLMHVHMPAASNVSHEAGGLSSRQHQDGQQQGGAAGHNCPAAAEQAPGQQQQRKKQRASCQYGNYHHYYGYRIGPSGFEDPRLKVLDPSWFKGADVLDVGCNEGLLTLALAVGCGCRSTTGIDIDPVLVAKACTNLSRTRTQLTQQMREAVAARDASAYNRRLTMLPKPTPAAAAAASDGPLSIVACSAALLGNSKSSGFNGNSSTGSSPAAEEPANSSPAAGEQQQWQHQREQHRRLQARVLQLSAQIKALTRVSFKAGNWLQQGCPANKYEVVTCFSVTKWAHLNWGDDGLVKLFHKFYRCLAPGGLLVLEPQPWKSYHSAVHKQGGTAAPFYKVEQLKMRPEGFAEFLTQRVGFELVQQLNAVSQAAGADAVPVKGFDRPILVLRKPAVPKDGQATALLGAVDGL